MPFNKGPERPFPDNAWHEGKVASWEGSYNGYRAVFEVIASPGTPHGFREVFKAGPHGEFIELFEPTDGHRMEITVIGDDDKPLDGVQPVTLDAASPLAVLDPGARFIMDTTASTDADLSYRCVLPGVEPIVE